MSLIPLGLVGAGCTPSPSPSAAPPSLSVGQRVELVQQLLDDVSRAAAHDDRPAFDARLSGSRPAAAASGDVWFHNLRSLGAALSLRARAGDVPGPDGSWFQPVSLSWRPPGGRQAAVSNLWLTVTVQDGRAVLLSDSDLPPGEQITPRPTWTQTRVTLAQRGRVSVIGPAGPDLRRWLGRATEAAAAVSKRLPRWEDALVVELPASGQQFERSIGVGHDDYAEIAAVAWPRGQQATAAVQVVVNPTVTAGLSGEALAVLLTHESVHVATRSFASAAPTWLVEGYADQIAYENHPAAQNAALRPLRDALRRTGLPTALPPESAFRASGPDLDLSYAQAWSVCTLLAARYGDGGLDRLYDRVGAGATLAAGLRELGTSEPALLRDWRTSLQKLSAPAP